MIEIHQLRHLWLLCLTMNLNCYMSQAAIQQHEGRNFPAMSLVSLSHDSDLLISDNPTLVVNEREPVVLVCQFTMVEMATLREIVWYREFDDGTSMKLLTHDAVMNITQINELARHSVRSRSATSIRIDSSSPSDDGWYQCHVGIYVSRGIVEKIGYIFLTVLVPPTNVKIAAYNTIEGNTLFQHNFSLVCRAQRSKPAAALTFSRNGVTIPEEKHINASGLLSKLSESLTELVTAKDIAPNIDTSIKIGTLPVKKEDGRGTVDIKYTILHLKVQIKGTKLWESSSYLLWTLKPLYDIDAEYGCLATHQSLEKAKTAVRTLRPPTRDTIVIDVTPPEPAVGENVMLQLKEELLENIFPRPILLWTNDVNFDKDKQKFFIGNKLLLRNVKRNNTVYKVRAFNALGRASATTKLVLKEKKVYGERSDYTDNSSHRNKMVWWFMLLTATAALTTR